MNQSGTITFTAPASANNHVEFSVGTVTGCTANGTTTVSAGTTCTVPLTFTPYYTGQRSVPLFVTLGGQVYSFGLTGYSTGPQAHLDTTNMTTYAGSSGTSSSTPYTYKAGVPLSPASGNILYQPEAVAVDSMNNIFIADTGHDLIRVAYVTANPQLACMIIIENPTLFGLTAGATTCAGATSQPIVGDMYTLVGVGGTSTYTAATGNGVPAGTAATNASGVTVDAAGNVFVGDQSNSLVRVIYQGGANIACLIEIENPTMFGLNAGATSCAGATPAPTPGFIYTVAGSGTKGETGDGGLATAAALETPNAVAVDSAGDMFMMEFTTNSTFGGSIRVVYNGGALAAQLISVENSGTTPVVGDIYSVAGNATVLTESGNGILARASTVGALTIYGVAIDQYDNVYFTDKTYGSTSYGSATNTALVRVVYNGTTSSPNPLACLIQLENPTMFGLTAGAGSCLNGATSVAGATSMPQAGYIYTVGGQPGTATTAGAATGSGAGTVDGVLATAQQFAGIYGIALDNAGDILVADRLNYTLRRISAATGIISTIAGFPTTAATGTFNASGSAQYVCSPRWRRPQRARSRGSR